MAANTTPLDRLSRRMALVEEHVRLENAHDLEGAIATFGDAARYDDEPWGAHYEGRDQVHQFYAQLMAALPDLSIEIVRRHVAAETIVLEVVIRGTHRGAWRGLPATGRRSRSHSVGSTPSVPATDWRANGFITIERRCYGSWAYFMSRKPRWETFVFF